MHMRVTSNLQANGKGNENHQDKADAAPLVGSGFLGTATQPEQDRPA